MPTSPGRCQLQKLIAAAVSDCPDAHKKSHRMSLHRHAMTSILILEQSVFQPLGESLDQEDSSALSNDLLRTTSKKVDIRQHSRKTSKLYR